MRQRVESIFVILSNLYPIPVPLNHGTWGYSLTKKRGEKSRDIVKKDSSYKNKAQKVL
jgi:hypothetical protein